ncbi:malto-oligosyltrehalose trehalohydrolase [Sphingobium sp. CR2-8]|uniref:malto-oligosyltrehalose trehalohydrolase n=1 Tax=Sphingobium sp. CR2-8 TaxID=1306534 RepID=UPI002DBCF0B6|nr:malto-oligosyltrehalose trehalohydrolase [Sphingobium sp. CR2-8]MEC3909196.1 malto-oligosyltrehalose trehalohydrolase [Sphingobium sp. CR2-8]
MTLWGPIDLGDGLWRFRLWAPDRPNMSLEIEGGALISMIALGEGWFAAEARVSPGTRYRFRLDADAAVPDPASRCQSGGVHGWSVVTAVTRPTRAWRGRPWAETVIYEIHAGLAGGFAAIVAQLPTLAELGVTAIELMPINSFGGTRNWGYDGVLPFAPAEAYGTPDDLHALIDAAHAHGMMIFLDVVYNHFGPDGNYLGAYAASFFHAERDTPWGGAVAMDRMPVAAYFRENALMWLNDYGFDGLRFDAVHAIGDNGFLDWLAREIRDATGADRHVHLMLENEHNDPDRLIPGRYDAQWNDDFHNVMHVMLTGEQDAYYADFAEQPAQKLARCLEQGFIYQGEASVHQAGKRRGAPSAHLAPTAFIAFLQNHDQVGNRAMGDRLVTLADPQRLRAATALLLLMPHIPMLFMGEEAGSTSPFLFFTDFHDELADAVRDGRRREFASSAAFASAEARAHIPDPNAPETFERSRSVEAADAEAWRAFYRSLLLLRKTHIVPGLDGCQSVGAQAVSAGAVRAEWRMGGGDRLTILLNLGDMPVPPVDVGTPLFAVGNAGAPASCAVWITPA